MAREALVFCKPEAVEVYPKYAKPFANDTILVAIFPLLAPCCDAYPTGIENLPGHVLKVVAVIRPDWIGSCPRDCDRARAYAFREQLRYEFSALIECETGTGREPMARVVEWFG